jgi:hypothetical protein
MSTSNRKAPIAIAVLAIVVALAVVFVATGEDGPEADIKEAVEQMALAAREHDAATFGVYIAPSFRGEYRGGSREHLLDNIEDTFASLKSLDVDIERVEVILDGDDKARAMVLFNVSGEFGPGHASPYPRFVGVSGKSPLSGRPDAFYTEFVKDADQWKLEYATLKVDPHLDDFPKSKRDLKG